MCSCYKARGYTKQNPMSKKNIILVGIGKRVRNDIIPALNASGSFNILGIYARKAQSATIGSKAYDINPLSSLDKNLLRKADWVYVGVPSKAVPDVLKFLSKMPLKNVGLLIDTPVLPWRQILAHRYFKH